MRPPVRLLAALWLGAAGCQQCSRPTSPAPTADRATVPSASAPSASAPAARAGDLCGPVEAHNRAVQAAASAELARSVAAGHIPADWVRERKAMAAPCWRWPADARAPTSAWAVRITRETDGGVHETTWSLVHIGRDGAQVALDETFTEACCSPTVALKNAALFDLDGDGEPEISFTIAFEGAEGGEEVVHHVYTFRGQRVVPYPLPFPGPLRDVDGDGRPDLLLEHRHEIKLPCVGHAYHDISGPSLLAHGLPDGTFSLTDAVASAHARRECPSRPPRIVARDAAGGINEAATARNVICARAWGASSAHLKSELAKGCQDPTFIEDCGAVRDYDPRACFHYETQLEWAERAPVVLAPAASK